jgi:penicillin-binding protein 1A
MDKLKAYPRKIKKDKFFSIPIIVLTILICIFVISVGIVFRYLATDLPSMSQLENYAPNLSTKIYDKDNNLIAELFTQRRSLITINEIPDNLQNAFIAIEDNDFYSHWGISVRGTTRALTRIFIRGRVAEGGSTITQQLSRSIFLTNEKSIVRKLKELLLTIQLERIYSKKQIMQFYMNQIYFGNGAHGVQSAAMTYFGKGAESLDLAECAMLAGIPKSPNNYNPFRDMPRAIARRNLVLRRMRDLGFITKEQEQAAAAKTMLKREEVNTSKSVGHYFVEYLRIMLAAKYGSETVYTSGYSIYTTLDMKMQRAAEDALEKHLTEFDEKRKAYFKTNKLEPIKVQGAVLILDPQTGAIRAMVGGRDFKETQFNRATQAKRQPGSSFKPIVYLAAIQRGWTAATLLLDKPLVFHLDLITRKWNLVDQERDLTALETLAETETEADLIDTNKIWAPVNYAKSFRGPVTLRTALALSINMCVVETIMRVGPARVIDAARNLGITTPLIDSLVLALGSSEVTLQEMVSAYAVFDAGGIRSESFVVAKIVDRNGSEVEAHTLRQAKVISPQVAFVMTNMLRSVVERGSGYKVKELKRPAAGKTGTTNDETDAWFIGFTPEYVAGVWVGYDDQTISLGAGSTGGNIAAPIWKDFMSVILEDQPIRDFKQPEGIEWALIDPRTGLLAFRQTAGAYMEAFIKGTAPKQYSRQATPKNSIDLTEDSGF